MARGPIKHTCPAIDKHRGLLSDAMGELAELLRSFDNYTLAEIKKQVQDASNAMDVARDFMDEIRDNNDELRTWGAEMEDKAEKLEDEVRQLQEEVEELKSELSTLQ